RVALLSGVALAPRRARICAGVLGHGLCSCRSRSRLTRGSGRVPPPAGRASLPVADGQVIAEVPQRAAYLLGHVLVADALEAGVGQLQGAGGGVPPHLPVEADLLGEGLGVIAAGLEVGVDLPVGDLLVG